MRTRNTIINLNRGMIMNESKTIKDVVEEVEKSSTTFEKTNTDLKRKF